MIISQTQEKRPTASALESHFAPFRRNIIGIGQTFETPFGEKPIVYADWTASGRLYGPIEDLLRNGIAPFVGNTHTETTVTGSTMTLAYHQAKDIIKRHVGAHHKDVLISSNSGMTGVVNKFQRILGLKIHEKYMPLVELPSELRPIVFVTHMEHHSNQTSWLETIADVEIIKAGEDGLVCLDHLRELLTKYAKRKIKIAAITSCSNVTGIATPYHDIAELMHRSGGLCFVDFACSAPYINIDMRPAGNELRHLDAIYFSPHKFLGGPGGTGILIFDPKLYKNRVPDNPGGGTVDWTNPWGGHKYIEEIEAREDGGTPAFLPTIRVALAVRLKEQMGVENILAREHQIMDIIWEGLSQIPNLRVLASDTKQRLGVVSFYIEGLHYNLGVKLLNDRYGIQMRGGCSCAGTYGHYLLNVDEYFSQKITSRINLGDLSAKPGWIRMSIHPTTTDEEARYILAALKDLAAHYQDWATDYEYDITTNEFTHKNCRNLATARVKAWFEEGLV
jgi:selenocysteine lyase/cysteine desulfurase